LPTGPSACACATYRGGRPDRDTHLGIETRAAADTCRRCWRSQLYTEVARAPGMELRSPRDSRPHIPFASRAPPDPCARTALPERPRGHNNEAGAFLQLEGDHPVPCCGRLPP